MTSKAEVVVYQKLVRDLVPERIAADGLVPVVRELSREEYRLALRSKLCEEFRELRPHAMNEAPNAPELEKEAADVYEVLCALAEEYGHQLDLLQYACHRPEYPTFSLRMRRWHLFDVAIDAALMQLPAQVSYESLQACAVALAELTGTVRVYAERIVYMAEQKKKTHGGFEKKIFLEESYRPAPVAVEV